MEQPQAQKYACTPVIVNIVKSFFHRKQIKCCENLQVIVAVVKLEEIHPPPPPIKSSQMSRPYFRFFRREVNLS